MYVCVCACAKEIKRERERNDKNKTYKYFVSSRTPFHKHFICPYICFFFFFIPDHNFTRIILVPLFSFSFLHFSYLELEGFWERPIVGSQNLLKFFGTSIRAKSQIIQISCSYLHIGSVSRRSSLCKKF